MRAREPDVAGHAERDGVRIGYEVFGEGERTILLMPTWAILPSRVWKPQVPQLARRHRVITFDARGSGRSDRPEDASQCAHIDDVHDALAVLDAVGVERPLVVSQTHGSCNALIMAALHPERVAGVLGFSACVTGLTPPYDYRTAYDFDTDYGIDEGWARENRHSWERDFRGYLEHFFGECFSEPHSTKQIEDAVGWGLDVGREMLQRTWEGPEYLRSREHAEETLRAISCPVLIAQGSDDRLVPPERAIRAAELTGGRLVMLEGSGHVAPARDPVRCTALIEAFAAEVLGPPPAQARRWRRAAVRTRRALMISSPIGLGHARRDVAIARELRALVPGLEIDWLAQHPLTAALSAAGERVHPASAELASESAHLEAQAGSHALDAFGAIRDMDEILAANYMVFRDLVREEDYDVWIGDEAWEVDHFLHENPEDKTAAYVFLTDFVGWLPLPGDDERRAFLCADLNAEMLELVERYPRIRDRAIFVGEPGDVADAAFGPGLPGIREWTERHFDFCGQIVDAAEPLRNGNGNGDGPACVIAVGGSGVGAGLLSALAACHPAMAERIPGLHTTAVCGPRIDPASLEAPAGVEVLGYVPDLDRRLAGADVALVQGGLSTTMELVAAGTPFVSFPLQRHFEQRIHVARRLARHGHTRSMEAADVTPERVAGAVEAALREPVRYRPVANGGAARAAGMIAELL